MTTIRVYKRAGRAVVKNVSTVDLVLVRSSDGAEVTLNKPGETLTVREGEQMDP